MCNFKPQLWIILVGLLAAALIGCSLADLNGFFPTSTPAPSPTPLPPITVPPDRDLFRLTAELRLGGDPNSIPRTIPPRETALEPGHIETLMLVNFLEERVYPSQFELRLVSPRAYWYVEDGQTVTQPDLELAAQVFESTIYPSVTAAFGKEWSPGVDGDPRIHIAHADLTGAGGYFGSGDEYPKVAYPRSNQREIIYLNSQVYRVGDHRYLGVVAHELQHMVHWNQDNTEETWINEGLSEFAETVGGYPPRAGNSQAARAPQVSLIHWPLEDTYVRLYYEGARLFFHYFAEHYGGTNLLFELVSNPEDGVAGIESFLSQSGSSATFREVFGDWVVANFLDDSPGLHGYTDLTVEALTTATLEGFEDFSSTLPQYSAHYLELIGLEGPAIVRFNGESIVPLLPTDVGRDGCWWGNTGDSIDSTLTADVDLSENTKARLSYEIWHEIEVEWDYGYIEVSNNNGHSWDVLDTPYTSQENPVGNNFGAGYTGDLLWAEESIDLSAYAGQPIKIRFQYVTDDSKHGSGLCLRGLSVYGDGHRLFPNWRNDGFVVINNRIAQDFIVQVIETGPSTKVSEIPLDQNSSGTFLIPQPSNSNPVMVVVAALAPLTRQPASYTISVESAE